MSTGRALRSNSSANVPGIANPASLASGLRNSHTSSHKSRKDSASGKKRKVEKAVTPEKRRKLTTNRREDGKGLIDDIDSSPARAVEPHRTNVPLVTPKGSRLVAYPTERVDVSPSKTGLPKPISTTTHVLEEACAHLIAKEPKLRPLIEQHYCRTFCPEGLREECEPFKSLCGTIMGQQVSGAAAMSIKKKFVGLFKDSIDQLVEVEKDDIWFPSPTDVAPCTVPFLRQAGLSERKAEYIKGLAEKFASGELSATMLLKASDEEVLEKLTAVRGLGRWSVEMFACFGLKRMDIFSTGDLGVQRGMAAFIGRDVKRLKGKGGGKWKYMSEQEMLALSEKFAPYRSVFMWYMWRVEDIDTNVVEGL